jgi:hypothetical protein
MYNLASKGVKKPSCPVLIVEMQLLLIRFGRGGGWKETHKLSEKLFY